MVLYVFIGEMLDRMCQNCSFLLGLGFYKHAEVMSIVLSSWIDLVHMIFFLNKIAASQSSSGLIRELPLYLGWFMNFLVDVINFFMVLSFCSCKLSEFFFLAMVSRVYLKQSV